MELSEPDREYDKYRKYGPLSLAQAYNETKKEVVKKGIQEFLLEHVNGLEDSIDEVNKLSDSARKRIVDLAFDEVIWYARAFPDKRSSDARSVELQEQFTDYVMIKIIYKFVNREILFSNWKKYFFCYWEYKVNCCPHHNPTRAINSVFWHVLRPLWQKELFDKYQCKVYLSEYLIESENEMEFPEVMRPLFHLRNDSKVIQFISENYIEADTPVSLVKDDYDFLNKVFKKLVRSECESTATRLAEARLEWALNRLDARYHLICEKLLNGETIDGVIATMQLGSDGAQEIEKALNCFREVFSRAKAYDFHIHTRGSDGFEYIGNVTQIMPAKDLDGVAILDHNEVYFDSLTFMYLANKIAGWPQVIVGEEIEMLDTTELACFNVVSMDELEAAIPEDIAIPERVAYGDDAFKKVRKYLRKLEFKIDENQTVEATVNDILSKPGRYILVTHPHGRKYSYLDQDDSKFEELIEILEKKDVDLESTLIIEGYNAKSASDGAYFDTNQVALRLADKFCLKTTCGSDSHAGLLEIGAGFSIIEQPADMADLVKKLGEAKGCSHKKHWFSDQETQERLRRIIVLAKEDFVLKNYPKKAAKIHGEDLQNGKD